MAQREVQSLEVSCFIQATEDEAKVRGSVKKYLGIELEPELDSLEGHFGNRILHAKWHLTGEEAWTSFRTLVGLLGTEGRSELKRNLSSHLDEHGALYLRLNKQTLVGGVMVFTDADPVRVKVKPRGFMMRGAPEQFYERLMELT